MADKHTVLKCVTPVACLCLFATLVAPAATLPTDKAERAAGLCAAEVATVRGVWRSPTVFLPVFANWELVQYLASLGRAEGVSVLPVYTSDPACFRSNHVVFLSTGFILKTTSELELIAAIRRARVQVQSPDLPSCVAMPASAPAGFSEIVRCLAAEVAAYQDLTARRLRVRETAAR